MPVQTLTDNLGTAVVDGSYRYHLTRDFDEGEGSIAFIMLNPSQADHHLTDDSVDRCIRIAQDRNRQTLEVGNLYAWYTTYPRILRTVPDPIGPHNDCYLRCIATRCSEVVAAWGGWGQQWGKADLAPSFKEEHFKNRAHFVVQLLLDAMANAGREQVIYHLGPLTDAGYPRHPGRLWPCHEYLVRWDEVL